MDGRRPRLSRGTDGHRPGVHVSGLDEQELAVLRQVGGHWGRALGGRPAWVRALPIDPGLHRFPRSLEPRRRGRFAPVDFVETGDPAEIVATAHAGAGTSRPARAASTCRRVLLGAPLNGSAVAHERMRKPVALAILSSDALSSVAYGPEAMLAVLALAGSGALGLSLEISVAIVVLMIAVGLSYRQLIRAYPHGGGSYIVAARNLGELPALIVAGALMTEYVLTVAVSISAGVAAITSAVPGLAHIAVPLGLAAIAILLTGNLRGVRQAGAIFSAPTYAFVLAMFALIAVGLVDASGRGFAPTPVVGLDPIEGITVLLVLRAFSSGATAMTGIEAISNAVPAFQPPASRNARTVLALMVGLLVAMFAGLVVLMHLDGIVPRAGQTALSQLAHRSFGSGPLYVYVQAATALVLLLAANTAFNGFPRLLSFMARNGHAPRLFLRLGDRLAFSNGTIALAARRRGPVRGVRRSHRRADPPLRRRRVRRLHPLPGRDGRALVAPARRALAQEHAAQRRRRRAVGHRLRHRRRDQVQPRGMGRAAADRAARVARLAHPPPLRQRPPSPRPVPARRLRAEPSDRAGAPERPARQHPYAVPRAEDDESPDQLQHLAVVPIVRLDLASLRALAYAASLGQPVLAVHISPGDDEAARFKSYWAAWGDHLPLEVVDSPYRALVAPLACYIDALRTQRPELTLTVVLPEIIVKHRWQQLLHNGTARRLRRALRRQPGVVVTTIPLHLAT